MAILRSTVWNSHTMDTDRQTQITELNKLASKIIQDPIYSNKITHFIDALANLDASSTQELYNDTVLRCVGKIFNFYIDSREFVLSKRTDGENEALNLYKKHLIRWYNLVVDELLKIVSNLGEVKFSLNIQKLALNTLIKFLEEEGTGDISRW